MKKPIIIITGAGFHSKAKDLHELNIFNNNNVKINIGAASAKVLVENGYEVILLSKTIAKLKSIKDSLLSLYPQGKIDLYDLDLMAENDVKTFVEKTLKGNKTYFLVHSLGLGSGVYKLKDDNPYLHVSELPIDLPGIEFEIVVKSLLVLIKNLLPKFRTQKMTKVVVVNSMGGIRAYPLGFSHSAAKGGLNNAVRSLTLELNKENIFFTEILPGIVDTGMYDNAIVRKAVKKIGEYFGYNYKKIPMMSPYEIGRLINYCIESEAHLLSVNLVPHGQFPNLGA